MLQNLMPELLFLLLPVAAFSGWLVARGGCKSKSDLKNACANEPDYYKGLNFLLNEQPDKAIDVFIHLLEVDSETVETHLALGTLFRKRGEVDRAIRIHQNLIARPSLGQEQRANALLELGQDYMYAGLYDRAENLFNELHESGKLQIKALENLKEIYQQEKVWGKCLNVVKKLQQLSDRSYADEISHYYCELAESSQKNNDRQKLADYIRKARQASPSSVRPLMMEASLEVENGNFKKALNLFDKIIEDSPVFVSEILDKLVFCYTKSNRDQQLESVLNQLYKKTSSSRVLQRIVQLIRDRQGDEKAAGFLMETLRQRSSLQTLGFLTVMKSSLGDKQTQDILSLISDTLTDELSRRPAYICGRCGFAAKTLHWQCPGCRSWGNIMPVNEQDRNNLPCTDIAH